MLSKAALQHKHITFNLNSWDFQQTLLKANDPDTSSDAEVYLDI